MIDEITLRDFKAHRETVVRLKPLTILAGPNGAGKTSVLEAIELLGLQYTRPAQQVFQGVWEPAALRRAADDARGFALAATGRAGVHPRRLSLSASLEAAPARAEAPAWAYRRTVTTEYVDAKAVESDTPLTGRGNGYPWPALERVQSLALDPRAIAAPSAANANAALTSNGGQIATVLANLKLTDEDRFARVVEGLRRVVPQLERVHVVPTFVRESGVSGYSLVFDVRGGQRIPATSISVGTLVTLTLMTIVNLADRPQTLLLDDLDESLHPSAQARLMKALLAVTSGPDAVQIIATSHSPYILDCVEPEAVQVFALRDDGTVAVKCLADHPQAAEHRGTLTAGQLWTLDDEHHWVIDGAALVRILLFCEAEADARTVRQLVDEVLLHGGPPWLRELLEHHPTGVRSWVRDHGESRDWYDVHNVRTLVGELGIKPFQGHFGRKPADPGALMAANIARIARMLARKQPTDGGIDVLMLVWDMDKQGASRQAGLAQAADHVPPGMGFVVGCPDPIRETWVVAGFDAETDRDRATLEELRQELGFWPHEEPHRLRAQSSGAKRDAKRVVAALALDDMERERACLRIGTDERRAVLATRGEHCGLAKFLNDVERVVLARLGAPPRP